MAKILPFKYRESFLCFNSSLYSSKFVKLTKPKPLDLPLLDSRIIRLDTTDLNVF